MTNPKLPTRSPRSSRRFRNAAAALVTACLGVGLALSCSSGEPEGERTNVVIVVLDTLRPDRLGSYGYAKARTPQLDAFCGESFAFEKAQTAAPWTAPSLISLVTGLWPEVHHVKGFSEPPRLAPGVTTLAQVLSDEGYATAAFTEGGYARGLFGLNRGFQVFPASEGDEHSHTSNMSFGSRVEKNLERSLAWLDENAERDFCMLFHTYEPHSPFYPHEGFAERHRPGFDPEAFQREVGDAIDGWNEERRLDRSGAVLIGQARYYDGWAAHLPADSSQPLFADQDQWEARCRALGVDPRKYGEVEEIATFVSQMYDAEVEYLDGIIGRLFDRLEALGVAEDTVVVIVSDHGEGLGEHGLIEHGRNLFEELLNIVLVVHAPMLDAEPRRIPDVVRLVDVHPTVLELLGIEGNRGEIQGRSLVPLMRGDEDAPRLAFSHALSVAELDDTLYAVRDGRYRLIVDAATSEAQLFDLEADPDETRDVSAEEPEVYQRLSEALRAWREECAELTERLKSDETISVEITDMAEFEGLGYIQGQGSPK